MIHSHDTLIWLALGAFLAIFLLGLVVVDQYLQPKGRVSCADFGSYADIMNAYNHGATYLDRNGDGIPCNSRKPK